MVFVTVGTHEQPFDRLVKAVDRLAADGTISEPVFQQIGYSGYEPTYCEYSRFVPAQRMRELMAQADVIITHGGPSSFLGAIAAGKTPVVVPRLAEFDEHVNDHQVDFVHVVAERLGGIVPVDDIAVLPQAIARAREMSAGVSFTSHNMKFCKELSSLIEDL